MPTLLLEFRLAMPTLRLKFICCRSIYDRHYDRQQYQQKISIIKVMRLFQKISAGVLISFSLLIAVLAFGDLANPQTPQKDKEGAFAALVIFGLPPGILGQFLIWNVLRAERKEKEALARNESAQLQSVFYHLLKKYNGELTPLLFAMETKLSAGDARAYLDQKAKEFDANFEVDDRGDITYKFNVGRKSLGQNE